MQLALFWIFASFMLVFGALVILLRNPVSSAMSLVLSFVSLAALFVILEAFFIGIIQILVYAGAVMVLFLFIIMLLDLKSERSRRVKISAWVGGGMVLSGFTYAIVHVVRSLPLAAQTATPLPAGWGSDVAQVGFTLFSKYNMPLQIIGVILLVATIGVVVLSRKELK
jgi:NADH-quinone oxidoreductase subunit J